MQAQKGTLVYTKWHDKKDISFLSTNVLPMEEGRQVERTVRGQKTHITKPKVADVYTANMGGIQIMPINFAHFTLLAGNRASGTNIYSGLLLICL